MLDAFKVKGKDKISKAVGKINTLVTDLEQGIAEVHAEKTAKEAELVEKKEAWAQMELDMNNEINSLDNAAAMGSKLKENIANLLK